ncbi:MAG: hypothetical protein K2M95_05785 [Clostridiales bacterium]|nr:hypothetical protein [Clostridiales bacterium]
MKSLKGLEGVVEYAENSLVCKLEQENAISLFHKSRMFGGNEDLQENCMQLGWKTMGVFEENDNGFTLRELLYDDKTETELKGRRYGQVTTRAVHTCTFAYITFGNCHILGHLDDDDLDWGLRRIEEYVKHAKDDPIGFCSHIDYKTENMFSDCLRAICRKGFVELYRHRRDGKSPSDEGELCELMQSNLYGHMEIGLCREDDGVKLFGDITDVACPIKPGADQDPKVLPLRHFDTQCQLLELLDDSGHIRGW